MTGVNIVLGITTLAFMLSVVVSSSPYYQLTPGYDHRSSRRILIPSTLPQFPQQQPRVFFPLEVNVPDVINGILSTFRFIWGRFQSFFGIGSSEEIVGAKDPPAPLTPSPALQAVPLAPDDDEEEYKSPVKTVSVEVDDPVRHPAMHRKTKIKNRKGVRVATTKKKTKRKKSDLSAQWEMIAMDEGWF